MRSSSSSSSCASSPSSRHTVNWALVGYNNIMLCARVVGVLCVLEFCVRRADETTSMRVVCVYVFWCVYTQRAHFNAFSRYGQILFSTLINVLRFTGKVVSALTWQRRRRRHGTHGFALRVGETRFLRSST